MDKDLLRKLKANSKQYEKIAHAAILAGTYLRGAEMLFDMNDTEKDLFLKLINSDLKEEIDEEFNGIRGQIYGGSRFEF